MYKGASFKYANSSSTPFADFNPDMNFHWVFCSTRKKFEVLNQTLLSFLGKVYPDGHHFMGDNNPNHTSNEAKDFLTAKGVN